MALPEQEQSFALIKGQVARILLDHAGDSKNGHNQLAQRDIADMLGTGWGTVHLSLKSLFRDGIIKIEHNRIIINKELALKAAEAV